MNLRGFGPDALEKMLMLKSSTKRMQFNGVFFSSPNRVSNSNRREEIKKKMISVGRNIQVNASDAGIKRSNNVGCLPRGTLSVV